MQQAWKAWTLLRILLLMSWMALPFQNTCDFAETEQSSSRRVYYGNSAKELRWMGLCGWQNLRRRPEREKIARMVLGHGRGW